MKCAMECLFNSQLINRSADKNGGLSVWHSTLRYDPCLYDCDAPGVLGCDGVIIQQAHAERSGGNQAAQKNQEAHTLSKSLTTQAQRPGARDATTVTATFPPGSLQRSG